jgi:hypothetical protein
MIFIRNPGEAPMATRKKTKPKHAQPQPEICTGTDLEAWKTINANHRQIIRSQRRRRLIARRDLETAKQTGDLLVQIRTTVGYGEWGETLKEHFKGSYESANCYVNISERWERLELKTCRSINHARAVIRADYRRTKPPEPKLPGYDKSFVPEIFWGDAETVWYAPQGDKAPKDIPIPNRAFTKAAGTSMYATARRKLIKMAATFIEQMDKKLVLFLAEENLTYNLFTTHLGKIIPEYGSLANIVTQFQVWRSYSLMMVGFKKEDDENDREVMVSLNWTEEQKEKERQLIDEEYQGRVLAFLGDNRFDTQIENLLLAVLLPDVDWDVLEERLANV